MVPLHGTYFGCRDLPKSPTALNVIGAGDPFAVEYNPE